MHQPGDVSATFGHLPQLCDTENILMKINPDKLKMELTNFFTDSNIFFNLVKLCIITNLQKPEVVKAMQRKHKNPGQHSVMIKLPKISLTSSMPVPTPNFRPFLTPLAGATTPPFPMWPVPGLFPETHNLFGRHKERKELSPNPAAARDRSEMYSGSSSDKEIPLPPLIPRNSCGDSTDRDSA